MVECYSELDMCYDNCPQDCIANSDGICCMERNEFSTAIIGIIVGVAVFLMMFIIVCCACCKECKRKREEKKKEKVAQDMAAAYQKEVEEIALATLPEQPEKLEPLERLEISRWEIENNKEINRQMQQNPVNEEQKPTMPQRGQNCVYTSPGIDGAPPISRFYF